MSTCKPDRQIPFTEIAQNLDKAFDQADPMRAAGLTQLARIRTAKLAAQEREQQRLIAKLGATHPRVQALAQKRTANVAMVREVNLTLERATTPTLAADPNAWLLHGRVMNRERQGLPGLTIALVDAQGTWLRELGYACTDKRGYFKLSVARVKGREANAVTAAAVREAQAFIRVTDKQNAVLHTDTKGLTPRLGQVDYREIVLGEKDAECRRPEDGGTSPQPTKDDDTRPAPPKNEDPAKPTPPKDDMIRPERPKDKPKR